MASTGKKSATAAVRDCDGGDGSKNYREIR